MDHEQLSYNHQNHCHMLFSMPDNWCRPFLVRRHLNHRKWGQNHRGHGTYCVMARSLYRIHGHKYPTPQHNHRPLDHPWVFQSVYFLDRHSSLADEGIYHQYRQLPWILLGCEYNPCYHTTQYSAANGLNHHCKEIE